MPLTCRALLTDAARRLAAAGVESPRVDAELLLAHVLGVSRAGLLTLGEVPDDAVARFEGLTGQRADRVPLQHLTGRAPEGDPPVDVLPGNMPAPGLLGELDGRVDLVVSTPPYVPDGATVPRE